MATYRVKFVYPCQNNNWQADVFERNIDAERFEDLLCKAISNDDIELGVRILEIWLYNKNKGEWRRVR
jgi:hypothetical protein